MKGSSWRPCQDGFCFIPLVQQGCNEEKSEQCFGENKVIRLRFKQPCFDIVKAGHIEILVTDLEKARDFYVNKLGFFVSAQDKRHHYLLLTESDEAGVGHIAFRVKDENDRKSLRKLLEKHRLKFKEYRNEEKGVERSIRFEDPFGFPVEFYSSMAKVEWMIRSYHLQTGARVSRLDHFNLLVPDVSSAFKCYSEELGFVCTELTEMEDEKTIWAAWLRRKHTCHDVALM